MQANHYDYIIAGAGASGLSLLWYILNSDKLTDKTVLLVDKSPEPEIQKTWAFWDQNNLPDEIPIRQSWNELEICVSGETIREKLSVHSYHCVKNTDYSRWMLKIAENHGSTDLLQASILGFSHNDGSGIVLTDKGNYSAKWIFQSVLEPPGLDQQPVDISLKQHFLGIEIKTDTELFDPGCVTLMDFDIPQDEGVTFFYILPWSKTEALVEYTFFTENILQYDRYMAGIKNYLDQKFGLKTGDYVITGQEQGVIPMEDRRYPAWYNPSVLNMGTMGGLTKPSSGYTFKRIHRHCAEIVKELEKGNPPPETSPSSYRFRAYDMMLLWIIKNEPAAAVTIFRELFKRNNFDNILTFMEENSNVLQELKIMASVPAFPFLKSIRKMKHRIFRGT